MTRRWSSLSSYTTLESPLGPLLLAGDADRLSLIAFHAGEASLPPRALPAGRSATLGTTQDFHRGLLAARGWTRDDRPFQAVARQLASYFAGALTRFDVRVAPAGTAFQRRVWRELEQIPYGETISYGELARRIGQPSASRAVGAANGRNPIPIIIPCHRVIGARGRLVGYGGGLPIKRWLLAREGCRLPFDLDGALDWADPIGSRA